MKKNLQKGFSLIELLVVVAIIGVLAAAGLLAYNKYLDSSKAETANNNLKTIQRATKVDMASLLGTGTSGTSDLILGMSTTSTCNQIAIRMVETINGTMANPYSKEPNTAAAYGNLMVQSGGLTTLEPGAKIIDGAIIVSCYRPDAMPGEEHYRLYSCVWVKDDSNSANAFHDPNAPPPDGYDVDNPPENKCPPPPVKVVLPGVSSAYLPPQTP